MLNNILLSADEPGGIPSYVIWIVLGAVLLIMLVLPMFTRRKQATQVNDMLNSIRVGDKIKTVGGIIGTVVRVDSLSPINTDKEFVIETGEDIKSQIRIDAQAILTVMNKTGAQVGIPESARASELSVGETVDVQEPSSTSIADDLTNSDGDYKYEPK